MKPKVAGIRYWVAAWLLVGALVGLSACIAPRGTGGGAKPRVSAPVADDRAPIEWARNEPYLVVVRKTCRTVSVYRYGEWLKTYGSVSFGREPGKKHFEGDRRTPVGLYMIVGKRHHPRWSRFLLLDYPNLADRAAYETAVALGEAPAGPGGQVGIHGTDKPRFNEVGIDWTFGCVSLRNEDVRDLYALVDEGTLVLIEE